MILLTILSAIVTLVCGLIFKYIWDRYDPWNQITQKELWLGSAILVCLLVPAVTFSGHKIAVKSELTHFEFINGLEVGTTWEKVECSRDGPCRWEYDCDPYQSPRTRSVCTGSGENYSCRTEIYYVTEYHSCPYCDEEWVFKVETTLGTYLIDRRLPTNPNENRWRERKRVPEHVIRRAGTGIPQFWAEAKDRIDAGDPAGVTELSSYDNYIAAAGHNTLFEQYSQEVQYYLENDQLPPYETSIYNHYFADKVHFLDGKPETHREFQDQVGRLNGRLSLKQGDLHVVVTDGSLIADNYTIALKAYWQSKEHFDRHILAKNAVVVVLGVTNDTIRWSRAFTGMPVGNERLAVVIRNQVRDLPLSPDLFAEGGLVRRLVLSEYERISMSAEDEEDLGQGFSYLTNDINISWVVYVVLLFINVLVAVGVWFFFTQFEHRRLA